jgi:hypothetical protein
MSPQPILFVFFNLCNGFCPFLSKEKSLGSHDFYVRHVFCELEGMNYRRSMHKCLNMVVERTCSLVGLILEDICKEVNCETNSYDQK